MKTTRLLAIAAGLATVLAMMAGLHLYLVTRLADDPGWPPALAGAMRWCIALGGLSLVLYPIAERRVPQPYSRWAAMPGLIWMGVGFLLLMGTALTDALLFAATSLGVTGESSETIARARAALVLGTVGIAAPAAIWNALTPPRLRRVEVCLPRWPRARDGYRIVQITDIHIGTLLDRRFAAALTTRVNAMAPDLIAVTGDLVDGPVSRLESEVAPFAELSARDGVFFVTGNHDHYSGAHAWASHVEKLGMRVLRNELVVIGEGERAFELAGVDDHRGDMPRATGEGSEREDLGRALAASNGERAVVLLAHDPSTFKRAAHMDIDLQISGHTHGGQIWPFHHFVRAAIPFVAGLYERSGSQLYVSRGTGFWGPPMRLGAPAEVTEIVLRAPVLHAPVLDAPSG